MPNGENDNKNTLRDDLLRDFHSQFAQNQNHHQTTVITVFTAFIALIVVFVYATLYQKTYLLILKANVTNIKMGTPPYIVSNDLYFFLTLLLCLLFSIVFIYICQVGYAFRRDQYIVSKIRKREGLNNNIFKNYGTVKETKLFLPDFYSILLLFIFSATIVLSIWTIYLLSLWNIRALLFLIPCSVMFFGYSRYLNKYKEIPNK